jgi:hypothetical protein
MLEFEGTNEYDCDVVRLIRLMNADDMMLQMLDIGLQAWIPMLKAEVPDYPIEEYIERIRQKIDIDSLLYQMVPIYSRYYTREEITGLIVFYETSLGHKLIIRSPQIIQETIAANQTWLEALIKKTANDMDSLPLKGGN